MWLIAISALIGLARLLLGVAWRHKVVTGLAMVGVMAAGRGWLWLAGFGALVAAVWWSGLQKRAQRQVDRHGGGGMLLLEGIGAGVFWLIVHPFVLVVLAGTVWFGASGVLWGYQLGPLGEPEGLNGAVVGAGCWWGFLGLVLWAWHDLHPSSWRRQVGRRWWSTVRELQLRARWRDAMLFCRLAGVRDKQELLPNPVRVTSSGRFCDRVLVDKLPGQTVELWARTSEPLAESLRVRSVQVRPAFDRKGLPRSGFCELTLFRGEPLAGPVGPLPAPARAGDVDLSAVPVGVCEDGSPWTLRVARSHLLIAGATNSGKSNLLWALLGGLAPCVRDGLVAPWGIDPKGNELAIGEPMFARYAFPRLDSNGEVSEDAVAPMVQLAVAGAQLAVARGEAMHGATRQHEPTPEDPLVLVCLDEIVFFAELNEFPLLRKQFFGSLKIILSQGRSAGVQLVLLSQDARKEVLPSRHFFDERVLFRCVEPDEIKWVLGDGARDRGARCDEIPVSQPGVAYHVQDGRREPNRVKAGYWSDTHIIDLAQDSAPPASQRVIDADAVDLEDPFDHIGQGVAA